MNEKKRIKPLAVNTADPVVLGTKTDKSSLFLLFGTLAIVLFARLRLLAIPLERDEGGYAYIGRRIFSSSDRLYTDLLDIKLPGLYLLYGLFDFLPGSPSFRIHLGYLFIHAAALYLFYRLCHRMTNEKVASAATALFAISAVLPGVYGFAAHATQLLQLPLMAGLLLLWDETESDSASWSKIVGAGFCLGLAFIIKQPAVVFIVFGLLVLLFQQKNTIPLRFGRAFLLGVGSLLPFLSIAGYMEAQGRFTDFWAWTFEVPTAQTIRASETSVYLKTLLPKMIGNNGLFWAASLCSAALVWISDFSSKVKLWSSGLFFLALGSVGIGFGFLPHYFVPAIPWGALCVALGLFYFFKKSNLGFSLSVIGIGIIPILLQPGYFFKPNYAEIMEKGYHWNGFAEIDEIGKYLKKRLKPGQTIAIYGSEPQLYYYTDTRHCSPHLYAYTLMRDTPFKLAFQHQFLSDIEACSPDYVVVTASEASWMPGFAETDFFKKELFAPLNNTHTLIGRANIGQIPMDIVWGEAMKNHPTPQCPPIFIFQKK